MSSYVSAALRRLVAVRAEALCEYCLMHEDDAVFGCEFDHIQGGDRPWGLSVSSSIDGPPHVGQRGAAHA